MNTLGRYRCNLYYIILVWGLSMLAGILSGCTIPATSSNTPAAPTSKMAVSAEVAATATETITVEPATPSPTPMPTLTPTPSPTAPVIIGATIRRSTARENQYFIEGKGTNEFERGDLLVVYAKDPAGFEYDAAVMYVLDSNEGNLIAKTIFQNPDAAFDTLDALHVDNNFTDVNLTSMVTVDTAFVGFIVGKEQIRIHPNESVREGDELLAYELTEYGEAFVISPTLKVQIGNVSISGEMARASILGTGSWPTKTGTLLISQNTKNTYTISVSDFSAESGICVRQGDEIKVSAEGTMTVGEFVGMLGPEGKDYFQLLGLVTTPIDPVYDIIPQFPHGVLMFRIADPALGATEGWLHYDTTKQFQAERAGCLEFDINDKDNSDNSGAFSVQIDVNP